MSIEKILFISPSTQDKKTWALTFILGILPLVFFGWKMLNSNGFNLWGIMFVTFLPISIAGFVATPYKYVLTGTDLIIKRYLRDIRIPLSKIQSIQLIPKEDKKTIWRSFGFAGPFGYFGFFTSSKYAKLSVFARRNDNWTLIIADGKKYVIAPDDLQLIEATVQHTGKTEAELRPADVPTKKWLTLIPIAIVTSVALLIFLGYREPTVKFESNSFKMKGLYGVNLPFAEIAEADTIAWNQMPAISIRTNGISLNNVHRGKFKTKGGEKVHLSVHGGVSPVIKIVGKDGSVYYINRKNAIETKQIFNKIKK